MSIEIKERDTEDPVGSRFTVWMDTEPGAGNQICVGCGDTRDQAIQDAIGFLVLDIGALIELRRQENS